MNTDVLQEEEWFLDRVKEYGQGYPVAAIELAYRIHQSLTIIDPADRSYLSFSINNLSESRFSGIEFKIFFDLGTSWEDATAGPVKISISLPVIELAPDFTNPPTNNDKFIVLDKEQSPKETTNLGGIKSYYGPSDLIYMEVFFLDSWIKTLIFASRVPLSIASAENLHIYRSEANSYSSSDQTNSFPKDNFENEMYSKGNFPVDFQISDSTVTLEATFKDSIFDSGLYRIFEYELYQYDTDGTSFTAAAA